MAAVVAPVPAPISSTCNCLSLGSCSSAVATARAASSFITHSAGECWYNCPSAANEPPGNSNSSASRAPVNTAPNCEPQRSSNVNSAVASGFSASSRAHSSAAVGPTSGTCRIRHSPSPTASSQPSSASICNSRPSSRCCAGTTPNSSATSATRTRSPTRHCQPSPANASRTYSTLSCSNCDANCDCRSSPSRSYNSANSAPTRDSMSAGLSRYSGARSRHSFPCRACARQRTSYNHLPGSASSSTAVLPPRLASTAALTYFISSPATSATTCPRSSYKRTSPVTSRAACSASCFTFTWPHSRPSVAPCNCNWPTFTGRYAPPPFTITWPSAAPHN